MSPLPFESASPSWQHAASSSSSSPGSRPGPPDVSATPQARLLGWESRELAPAAHATFACFGFELGGYTDELAQVVLDRTEPFAVRAAGGVDAAGVIRTPWQLHGFSRRQAISFTTPTGEPMVGVLAFGFEADALQACFGVCGPAAGPCAEVIAAADFVRPSAPPPPPSLGQRAALGLLEHPRPAAGGFLLAIALVVALLLFTRGARARA